MNLGSHNIAKEGYVNAVRLRGVIRFNYVYNFTDHLGNIRLSYTDDVPNGQLKILEENHYYPFGLKHTNYNSDKKKFVKNTDETAVNIRIPSYSLPKKEYTDYQYKYNGKEFQDELGLNVTAMDFRQYDSAIGRFMNIDLLSDLAPMWTPYRFAFNNPIYWKDPSGLIEFQYDKNGKASGFTTNNEAEINALMDFLKNNKDAGVADIHSFVLSDMQNENSVFSFDLQGVEVVGNSKSKESNSLDYANNFNSFVELDGNLLALDSKKGGSFRLFKSLQDGKKWAPKYYPDNRFGSGKVGKHKIYNVSKVLKKGTIAATVILGAIEVGDGIKDDYNIYQSTGYTNGKNTVVAGAKVGTGVAVGYGVGAGATWLTSALAGAAGGSVAPGVGTVIGFVAGGIAGYYASEYVGNAVEKAYE